MNASLTWATPAVWYCSLCCCHFSGSGFRLHNSFGLTAFITDTLMLIGVRLTVITCNFKKWKLWHQKISVKYPKNIECNRKWEIQSQSVQTGFQKFRLSRPEVEIGSKGHPGRFWLAETPQTVYNNIEFWIMSAAASAPERIIGVCSSLSCFDFPLGTTYEKLLK
jgi:hypothetical protein